MTPMRLTGLFVCVESWGYESTCRIEDILPSMCWQTEFFYDLKVLLSPAGHPIIRHLLKQGLENLLEG